MAQVRARLTQVQRAIAIGQLQAGRRQCDVARAVGVSQQAISALSRKFQMTGNVDDLPRSGRPKVTTPREDRSLVNAARRNPFLSGNILTLSLIEILFHNIDHFSSENIT